MTAMRSLLLIVGVCATLAVSSVFVIPDARAGEIEELSPAAVAAVEALYPDATIVDVGQERERGVLFYEVAIHDAGQRIEIEVTADGVVGEVEMEVAMADLPQAVQDGISSLTGGVSVEVVELHEIHGVPRGKTFAVVDPPRIAYEMEFKQDGARMEIAVGEDGSPLALEHHEDADSSDDDSDSSDDDSESSDDDDSDSSDHSGDDSSSDDD